MSQDVIAPLTAALEPILPLASTVLLATIWQRYAVYLL
jgi:hypothetical protein